MEGSGSRLSGTPELTSHLVGILRKLGMNQEAESIESSVKGYQEFSDMADEVITADMLDE